MEENVFFGLNNMRQDPEAEGRLRCLEIKVTPTPKSRWVRMSWGTELTERGKMMRT